MTWITPQVSEKNAQGTAFSLTGPADAPVVAFIHGLGLCQHVFDAMLPAFCEYRILRYDLFGHGQSDAIDGTATLKVFADQLVDICDDLELSEIHIVGFSIGGMINRRFALDHGSYVKSLVILNSPHDRGPAAQEAVELRAQSVRDQGAFSTFDAALQRWFTPSYLQTGKGPALVRSWREQVDAESYAQTAWVLANGVRELTGRDGDITAPTLVVTCENDSGSTPQMSHDIASEIAKRGNSHCPASATSGADGRS
ncbi:alpha/beta fold hydrolase [Yoonia sp. GPGPB17]|uniref:alpha/beta fold hydrolase n=1 Tax=Yoonia sp. GPGPB17 TaxID=3026147 RepID=UPI0030C148A8